MPNEYEQPVEPMSRTEDLLRTGTEEPVIAMSEIEKILRGEHIDRPHSRVADLLLQYNPSDILIEKRIEENGTYYATADAADGYYKVVVDTPVIPPTVLEHLVETISTNGTHTFTPGTGYDGYSDATITVNVPASVTSRGLTVNGTFSSAVDNKDGYSSVTVNVQEAPVKTTSLSVTENGTYVPGQSSEVSLTIPTIPDEVETEVSAGATITNFDNLRIEFTNKTTSAIGHVDIYPSAIAIQTIPMSFKDRTLIMGPDGDHYITIVNGYDSIIVLQKGYTITAMKLTSYSGYFDDVSVEVPPEPITEARSVENLPQPIASFNNGAEAPITSLKVAIEPQQEGSGDPSPTNIRPISGWDETVVSVNGINLCNIGSASFTRYKQYPLLLPAGTYTISSSITSTDIDDNDCYFGIYDSNNNLIASSRLNRNTRVSHTFTLDVKSSHIILYAGHNSSQSVGDDATWADIQIEIGRTPTTYSPYNGHTYTIALGDTYYGGYIDWENNQVIKEISNVDLGDLNYTHRSEIAQGIFSTTDLNDYRFVETIFVLCEIYKYGGVVDGVTYATKDKTFYLYYVNGSSSRVLYIKDTDYTDAQAFKTAMGGVQLVYELATPLTIQLTPTAVKSLRGVNNVYANTGNINDLDYIYVNDEVGTLINKTITANGSYCAVTDDNADGYLNIDVNLPNGTNTEY